MHVLCYSGFDVISVETVFVILVLAFHTYLVCRVCATSFFDNKLNFAYKRIKGTQ